MSGNRILAIDGGGIKGVFAAACLGALEETLGVDVGDYFDLIAGTSTGGIIALGLGAGMSANEILKFYEQLGPTVFRRQGVGRVVRQLVMPKYTSQPLRDA